MPFARATTAFAYCTKTRRYRCARSPGWWGVTERDIYALVRRLDCRPRLRLADDGRRIVPPAAQMALVARSLRELADIRRKREEAGSATKPERPRKPRYQWRPMLVSPTGPWVKRQA